MYITAVHCLICFLGLYAPALSASPIPGQQPETKTSFLVPHTENAGVRGLDGPSQLLQAYRKHNMPVPRGLLKTAERHKEKRSPAGEQGNTTTVSATPQGNGIEYVTPITIGGQTITVDFDTGSSDLWVFSPQLDRRALDGHDIYDANQSSTAVMMEGSTFNCSYGDGSGVTGDVSMDVVKVGGLTAPKQAVGMATSISDHFAKNTGSSGLLGLGFSSINMVRPRKQKTFFDNVMDDLEEPVFTADLRRQGAGAYEFGRVDRSKYAGDMAWVPVKSDTGYWQFTSDRFAVGDDPSDVQVSKDGAQAIADTGTTAILANAALVEKYYSTVPGAENNTEHGGFVYPCDTVLPDLHLDIGGAFMARIPGDDVSFFRYSDTMCFGGLQTTTTDVQIFGDIMFKTHFVAFNGGNSSIGIAEHILEQRKEDAGGAAPAPTTSLDLPLETPGAPGDIDAPLGADVEDFKAVHGVSNKLEELEK